MPLLWHLRCHVQWMGAGEQQTCSLPPTECALVCPKNGREGYANNTCIHCTFALSHQANHLQTCVTHTQKSPNLWSLSVFTPVWADRWFFCWSWGCHHKRQLGWAGRAGKPPPHVRSPAGSLSSPILSFPSRPDGFLPWCSGIQESESECLISFPPNVTGFLLLNPIG